METDLFISKQKPKLWRPLKVVLAAFFVSYTLETIVFLVLSLTEPGWSKFVPIFQTSLPPLMIAQFYLTWAGFAYFLICSITMVFCWLFSSDLNKLRKVISIGHGITQGTIFALVSLQTRQYYLELMIFFGVLAFIQMALLDDGPILSIFVGLFTFGMLLWAFALAEQVLDLGSYSLSVFWVASFGWFFIVVVHVCDKLQVLPRNSEGVPIAYLVIVFVFGNIVIWVGYVQLGWHPTS
jgi:hypothetical protein